MSHLTPITLTQALHAVEGRKEFAVRRQGGLAVFNYLVTLPDSFEGVRGEFRGIVFDEATGAVVSRPFHKFFNVNQKAHTQFADLQGQRATVWEKLDGSLIHCWRHPSTGDLAASTRSSPFTPQAQAALAMLRADPLLERTTLAAVDAGYTPMFELVGPENQVVVRYPAARLVYLHSRHRATGHYAFDEAFPDRAARFDIPFSELLGRTDREEFEGYVCQLEGGLWVKAKGKWYLDRHRAADCLNRPGYKLYEMALNNELDDVHASAADAHKPALAAVMEEVAWDYLSLHKEVTAAYVDIAAYSQSRKEFAAAAAMQGRGMFSGLMAVYDGREPTDFVKRRLMERYTLEKKARVAGGYVPA